LVKKHANHYLQACDEAIEKLSLASNNPQASLYGVVNQILYPLVQGCESKDLKIIKVNHSNKNSMIIIMKDYLV
jgi:hypothetical protein